MRRDYRQEFRAEFPDLLISTAPSGWPWERRRPYVFIEGHPYSLMTWKELFTRWRTPYGLWTCADGREVMFNRDYRPIWQRINGEVESGNPNEWVEFADQRWFHDGDNNPKPAVLKRMEQVLAAFKAGEDVGDHFKPLPPGFVRHVHYSEPFYWKELHG